MGRNAKRHVQGRVKDGKYEIDHVKPGKYTVAVRPVAGSKDDAKLPEKFRTADESGVSVEVKDGANNIDISLSAK